MDAVDRALRAFGVDPILGGRVLGTLAVLVAWLIVMRLVRRVLARTVDDPTSRFSMVRISGYVVALIALMLIARIWIQGIAGLATYFGLLSAGIAIALQDLITNLAGWLFILLRRPFRIGDRVEIGGHAGDVVDIRPFRFLMLEIGAKWVHAEQSTGRLLHVPNGWVFKHSVANYSEAFGYIWNEIQVVVTFESDWRKAKKALEGIVGENAEAIEPEVRRQIKAAAESFHIQFTKTTPVVWTNALDQGVALTMRYLCKPRDRRSSTSAMWEKILDAFAGMPDVDLAYPTTRFFEHATEGKTVTLDHDLEVESARSSRPSRPSRSE
jgi:small-conductance mechanosensitive channel